MTDSAELAVVLDDDAIGTLSLERNDKVKFRLLDSYKSSYPRPVLGQAFLDDLDRVHETQSRVPPWFSNLLPEGPLRDLIAKRAGVKPTREFFLLDHVGADLPGAVRILSTELPNWAASGGEDPHVAREQDEAEWRFSLAGVQLKFSARRAERGLTVPVSGLGGDWLLKLPDARFPRVPQNEYATMSWAQASGIEVPELALIDIAMVSGLPPSSRFAEPKALAVRRFDRPDSGHRVHQEDFAQILGLFPEEKYDKANYETVARLVLALAGEDGLREFLLRLVFDLASGNSDAHLKNWSLVYPDRVNARLSPAYDLVSTIQYLDGDALALNLARSKRGQDVSLDSFRRLARKIGRDEEWVVDQVESAVEAVTRTFVIEDYGYTASERERIESHQRTIPLFSGR